MDKTFQFIFLVWISSTDVFGQFYSPTQPLKKTDILSASYDTYKNWIDPYCVSMTSGQQQKTWPTGQSMENMIALIERLEIMLENDTDTSLKQHIGADKVAKLLLRRFRFDGYDPTASSMPYQKARDTLLNKISNKFFAPEPNMNDPNYKFPDKFFSQAELCSFYNMLSHNVYNINEKGRVQYSAIFRGKRQVFNNRQQTQYPHQSYGNYGKQNNHFNKQYAPIDAINNNHKDNNNAVQSDYLVNYPIREEGVVSFRGNKDEAIAAAKVLTGVVAGLTQDLKTSANEVLKVLDPGKVLTPDKQIDPILALTIGDLWGVATGLQNDEKQYYFGLKGQWSSGSCTTHYALTDIGLAIYPNATRNMKATKAELRGGIDGYLIGKNLQTMVKSGGGLDITSLRLSTILRSYYSKPKNQKSSTFTVSYCNREQQMNVQDLQSTASAYAAIMTMYASGSDNPTELIGEFNAALTPAQQKETGNGLNDFCSFMPSGTLDKSAPCETPSDIIYVIDASSTQKLKDSANIVSMINGNSINFRTEGGTVTIFANSAGQNNVNSDINQHIPRGTEQWPLVPIAFNSTNTGYAQCRIDDFNTTTLTAVQNVGKYLKFLNQTLFFYEWWNPRTNASAVPGKTAVLIDFDSVPVAPDSGTDKNDYNYYKDQLRYRHRDVRFLSLTNNLDLFKDIIRDNNEGQDSDKQSPNNIQQSASSLAKKICENPATFQYNSCNDKKSDNVKYEGFITPGYKQNWAMYPEFFLKSFDITFTFKPEEGEIKVCYNRWFPPENPEYCKELKSGEEGYFKISNPCKGKSFSSCDPLYFTVWGKDRTTNTCLDTRCLSLDQIKFTVTHSGVQCSSSNHLMPSTTFQLISLSIFAILYLFSNK